MQYQIWWKKFCLKNTKRPCKWKLSTFWVFLKLLYSAGSLRAWKWLFLIAFNVFYVLLLFIYWKHEFCLAKFLIRFIFEGFEGGLCSGFLGTVGHRSQVNKLNDQRPQNLCFIYLKFGVSAFNRPNNSGLKPDTISCISNKFIPPYTMLGRKLINCIQDFFTSCMRQFTGK